MVFYRHFKFGERSVIGLSDAGDVVIRPKHISVHMGGAHAIFEGLPEWDGRWEQAVFKIAGCEFDVKMDKKDFADLMKHIDWVRE